MAPLDAEKVKEYLNKFVTFTYRKSGRHQTVQGLVVEIKKEKHKLSNSIVVILKVLHYPTRYTVRYNLAKVTNLELVNPH